MQTILWVSMSELSKDYLLILFHISLRQTVLELVGHFFAKIKIIFMVDSSLMNVLLLSKKVDLVKIFVLFVIATSSEVLEGNLGYPR